MEACRVPIELCEAIMDTFRPLWSADLSYGCNDRDFLELDEIIAAQHVLCACALTCRAWRVRAQLLLWVSPCVHDGHSLYHFIAAVRTTTQKLLNISQLWLREPTVKWSTELFMHTFPNLRRLICIGMDFDSSGFPLPIFRMRLPFFASITALHLVRCRFRSLRAVMDAVWAFPNLDSLRLLLSRTSIANYAAGGGVDLSVIRGHVRACQKLTKINLTYIGFPQESLPPFVAAAFGSAVTELRVGMLSDPSQLGEFLTNDAFPFLRSITVNAGRSAYVDYRGPDEPWLHAIVACRAVPSTLEKIVIEYQHDLENNTCCQDVVGTSEEVAGSPQQLPALLSGLKELTIRFCYRKDENDVPSRCAAYIHSILPNMHKVLRFEYFPLNLNHWIQYTLPLAVAQ